jgi:hypothetical protein
MKHPYKFAIRTSPNTTVTMFPTQEDLQAGQQAFAAGASSERAEQVVRKNIMSRLQRDGAEGAQLVPLT